MSGRIGVYWIKSIFDQKVYIGSATIDFSIRWKQHLALLRNGNHGNHNLQQAWNKLGEDNFRFEIIEQTETPQEARLSEQAWLDEYFDGGRFCYNLTGTVSTNTNQPLPIVLENPEELARYDGAKSKFFYDEVLSIRQAQTISSWFRYEKNLKISARSIQWKTPEQVSVEVLGAHHPDISILAQQIRNRVNPKGG